VNANQLNATITVADQAAGATKTITVFTPTPGGGTSNGQTLTINGAPDVTPPTVTVTSPAGGESWAAASSHNITWTATDDIIVANVSIALSTDGGATFPTAVATGIANSGTFAWSVPVNLTSTARIRVRALDGAGNVGSDSSHTNFSITGWTVTASADANGSIAPSGVLQVADGATPSFTITPNTGFHVQDVLVNGSSVGAVTNFTFPAIHANQTIAASFAINTYTLTLSTVGSGTVAAVPVQATYDHGTVVQLTATPAGGWNFDFWSGDASGSANPLSVTMDANKSITANFGQHFYTWNQTGTASWATATNWTPTRTVPAANDVLMFNNGATTVATGVPTQTIGQLLVSANTNVTLQAAAPVTVTIQGGAGADLGVAGGSTLQLTGANAMTLALGAGATGNISGSTILLGGSHRITATDPGSLVYGSGATCSAGVGFSGNAFGTTSLNSVEFHAGSLYQHIAGANPFGASAPNAVVSFLAGSRYRLDGPLLPSMSGRTYADFEYNNSGTQTPTGGNPVSVDSLVITQGTFNLNLIGGALIHGDIHVKPGATLSFSPASGAPVFSMSGSAPQSVDVQGAMTTNTAAVLDVNNASGVSLVTNLALNGGLSFTSGLLNTGGHTLAQASTSNTSGASQGTGWVNGNLQKTYAAGAFSGTLDVGDASTYAPIDVSGTGAGAGFNLSASTAAGDHPNLGTSTLDPARSVNRRWTLAPASAAGATWSATFGFPTSDVDLTADPNTFQSQVFSGSAWSPLLVGTRSANSTQVTGLSAATPGTQFAVANGQEFTLTVNVVGGGTVSKLPDLPTYPSLASVQLTANPGAGWAFSAWSGDLVSTNNPENLVMNGNKTVTSTFLDIAPPSVAVTVPNGAELLNAGVNSDITWTASDNAAVTAVDLELSRTGAGGPFESVATGLANTGTFSWLVSGPATSHALVRATAHDAAGHTAQDLSDAEFSIADGAGVNDGPVTEFALSAVWPNPVRRATRFQFALPRDAGVHLGLHDVQGRELVVLAEGQFPAGRHTVDWSSATGARLEPGLYFLRFSAAGHTIVRRFVLMK
jgi:hypothetical protein